MLQEPPPSRESEDEAAPTCSSASSSTVTGGGSSSSDRRSSSSSSSGISSAAAPPPKDGPILLSLPSRKPHRCSDPAWAAICELGGEVGPRDFKLVRRLGSGDVGTVYLCRLRNDPSLLYAMKVVDKRDLARKKKLGRAEAERRVLSALDHPFLPTLYADFDANPHLSCAVMEFCCGGDLHSLRHRQRHKRFPLQAVRFYGAEVLVALEYLHMMGILYRDLKPENVLIRADGHIMLSDFDLSLECTASPAFHFSAASPSPAVPRRRSWILNRLERFLRGRPPRRQCSAEGTCGTFVAEPVDARSNSFVGTHEYVAPEVAAGRRHGAAVDWWAFGVFLYELACGRTPFAGETNAVTLKNIIRSPVEFPAMDRRLKDLIAGLLCKDPEQRLGAALGAAELKAHPFFEGVNFQLLRSQRPPVVPGSMSKTIERRRTPPVNEKPLSLDGCF